MTQSPHLDPQTVHERIQANLAVLVDVREPGEFARAHVAGARQMPLAAFDAGEFPRGKQVILCCASGTRSRQALHRAQAAGCAEVAHLQGGLAAWRAAGLPVVEDRSQPISLMRQVQIVAGSLVAIGTVLGAALSPWYLLVPGFVGAGLIYAGASGSCMMAQLLARLPYNRPQRAARRAQA